VTDNKHSYPVPISDWIDASVRKIGHGIAWVYVLLVLVIITQVVLRKGFSSGLIVLEELQWHLYAVGVMFGISYAQVNNAHVRVDLFYGGFRLKTKRIIEIIGILTLVLPFIYIIFVHSLDFVADSWRINESSSSPSGLPWRWAVKSVIPASFGLLALAVISRLIRDVVLLVKGEY
jgi:TRAP-type mannitol/chloroaromatic compound transport system permease small subunit